MKIRLIVASLVVGLLGVTGAQASAAQTTPLATPYRESSLTGLKNVKQVAKGKTVTLDLVLKTRNASKLTSTALAVNTPGNSQFQQILTPSTFRSKFGQSASTT